MKKAIFLFLVFAGFAWTNSAFALVDGTETRSLSEFNEVDVSSGIDVTLVYSDETKVELETKQCDPEDVITKVEDGRLIIKYKQKKWGKGNRKVDATVYYNDLEGLEASSGSSIKSNEKIRTDDMDIEASSGANINVDVECEELSVEVSSGASVRIGGECTEQEVEVSSGGTYRALQLESRVAEVSASSGGNAKIWVKEELEAEASSGGNVSYKGDPTKTAIDSGFTGNVKKI